MKETLQIKKELTVISNDDVEICFDITYPGAMQKRNNSLKIE